MKKDIIPTAVIKQINILEAELGVRLLRGHMGVTLTKVGKSLLYSLKSFETVEKFLKAAAEAVKES